MAERTRAERIAYAKGFLYRQYDELTEPWQQEILRAVEAAIEQLVNDILAEG